jgi:hypothetical protein
LVGNLAAISSFSSLQSVEVPYADAACIFSNHARLRFI